MKKRKFYLFLAVALAFVFVGCGQDELMSGNPGTGANTSKDAVYMNVTVQLPVGAGGTRSNTTDGSQSTDGIEVGQEYENSVSSLLLVLADKDNGFIGCAEKSEGLMTKGDDGTLTTVQSISKSVLSAYYGDDGTLTKDESEINVFVFCNPTLALKEVFKNAETGNKTWCDAVCSITEQPDGACDNATIWGGTNHKGGFLMSSFEIADKSMPVNFSDWDNFTSPDKAFQFSGKNTIGTTTIDNDGAIEVERSVARFDFKDGSTDELGPNTYQVVKDADGNPVMNIQLVKMALVNMSKNFYYLRRVSDNGLSNGANFKLCGNEHGIHGTYAAANYVVDTDAQDKYNFTKDGVAANFYTSHFNFCLGNGANTSWAIDPVARNQWYISSIADVLKGEDDNDKTWNENGDKGDYKIWRYVTENTIPGVDKQQNGISTGVVFKGKMIAPKEAKGTLADAINNVKGDDTDPILYVYGNEIFVTWKEVRAKALEQSEGDPLYLAVFGNPKNKPVAEKAAGDGTTAVDAVYSDDVNSADYKWNQWKNVEGGSVDEELAAFKEAARTAQFTLYQSSKEGNDAGYYCYYFYWNRHNDNHNNGVMGPMEFAVVRNNVYKLAVTKINKLGHPRVTENDPDPVDPDTPDEKGDVYLRVSVKVLPWVVRINNIEF